MLSSSTPFKIIHDENALGGGPSSSIKKGGLSTQKRKGVSILFDPSTQLTQTPVKLLGKGLGGVTKSARKALGDISSNQINIGLSGQTSTPTIQSSSNSLLKSNHKVPIKIISDENESNKLKSVIKKDKLLQNQSNNKFIIEHDEKIIPNIPDEEYDIDEMLCTRSIENNDEDPYDFVMRKSSRIKKTINKNIPTKFIDDKNIIDNLYVLSHELSENVCQIEEIDDSNNIFNNETDLLQASLLTYSEEDLDALLE